MWLKELISGWNRQRGIRPAALGVDSEGAGSELRPAIHLLGDLGPITGPQFPHQ